MKDNGFKDYLHEFNSDSDISLDLWPFSQWSEGELDSLVNIFDEFGEISVELSSGPEGRIKFKLGYNLLVMLLHLHFLEH